jgi:hypothetical protein
MKKIIGDRRRCGSKSDRCTRVHIDDQYFWIDKFLG